MLTRVSSGGFTLVELMFVMTVIGILMLIGVPEFSTWQANAQIRSVAEILQNDLRQSRAEAVRRNRQVALVLTNETPVGDEEFDAETPARNWIVLALPLLAADEEAGEGEEGEEGEEAGEGGNEASSSAELVSNHVQNGDSRIQITGSRTAICFNSVGRLTARAQVGSGDVECTAGAFDFDVKRTDFADDTPGIHRLRIQVSTGGQIRMCDTQKTSPAPDAC